MTTRDNDTIIEVYSDVAVMMRESLIRLLQAGAPTNLLHPLLSVLDMADSVPYQLADKEVLSPREFPEDRAEVAMEAPRHVYGGRFA